MPRRARKKRSARNAEITPSPQASFEGFVLCVGLPSDGAENSRRLARRVVSSVLGKGWRITDLYVKGREFLVRPVRGRRGPSVGRAWDLLRSLQEHRDIMAAEPAFMGRRAGA